MSAPHPRRADIEGLRAIAVVLVALGHAAVPHLAGGFVGVDVFFVISGFLITGLLVDEAARSGRVSIPRFYARRVRRILPMATLVTLAVVVAAYAWLGTAAGNDTARDAVWATLFLANVHFARAGQDYFDRTAPTPLLQHFWSLGVEEQFYLVWPLLVGVLVLLAGSIVVRRRLLTGVLVVVVLASIAWSLHQSASSPTAAYYSPFTRAHELALGGLLALAVRPNRRELPGAPGPSAPLGRTAAVAVGLLAIVVSAVVLDESTAFPGLLALVPTLGAVLVLWGGTVTGSPVSRLLGSAPMRFVGQRSYGFYLWHLPFLLLPATRAGAALGGLERTGLLVAAFALACLTYALVEDPVRRSAWLRHRPPALSLAVGVTLVVVVLAVSSGLQAGHRVVAYAARVPASPAGLPSTDQIEAAVARDADLSALPTDLDPPVDAISELGSLTSTEAACDRTFEATTADNCFLREQGDQTILLWGDSHSSMWAPGLLTVAKESNQKLAVLTKYSCPPLLDVLAWHPTDDRPYDECASYVDSALQVARDLRPKTVVITGDYRDWALASEGHRVAAGRPGTDEAWTTGLQATIAALQAIGSRVVVLGDIAYQEQDESVCLATHTDDVAACTNPAADAIETEHATVERAAADAAGATYVPVTQWMCTSTTCPPVVDGRVVYRDAAHLTRQYSLWLAGALGTATGLG